MTVSLPGLGSGIDTQSIINQLVALEQQKIDVVAARGQAQSDKLSAWATIRTALSTLSAASSSLSHATDWQSLAATSSDDSVSVSAGAGTTTGSLQFTVTSLAQSGILRSANAVSSLTSRVANDASLLVAAGGGRLGFSSLASDDNVSLGAHTITVTQASAGATKAGTGALGASTVIDNTNNALQLEVNGSTYNVVLASGTYDAQQLAGAVQQAATAAGAQVNVTTDASGALQIATAAEGSAATLRVTGGTSLTALSLTTDGAVLQGVDGQVSVDGGAAQVFGHNSAIGTGSSLAINAGGGTVTAVLSGGLRLGTVNASNVSTGDGSLGAVVAAINGAAAGVTAAAVQVGTNSYRLQVSSTSTGAGNDPNLAASEFDSTAIGGLTVLAQGTDAQITVGSGPGSYSITSATNTMSNVLPGVTLTLNRITGSPVTVTVAQNAAGLADNVQKLVDGANAVKQALDKATAYDPANQISSPLTGDLTADRLSSNLYNSMENEVLGSNPGSPGLAGVSVDKDGNYTFDRSKFLAAYAQDPNGMQKVFSQWGSSTSGQISFIAATDNTQAGTYAVNITQAATQAFSSSGGAVAAGTTVRASIGGTIAAYTVQAGDTAASIASGLNQAFAAQNLQIVASTNGNAVELRTSQYGTAGTMQVAWDGVNYSTVNGVDVAGTINGVTATGRGQLLSAPTGDATLAGMSIQVVGTQTGALGTITYTPGVAARVNQLYTQATDSLTGFITSTEKGIQSTQDLINSQVDEMNQRLVDYQNQLKAQFAALDTAMADLKNQQSWLAGQLSSLG
jgi:flagellar hook-associated protein 2